MFTDTHTHIYAEDFDPDRDDMILRAREQNLTRLFLPAIDSTYHEKMLQVSAQYPRMCYPMMGLHPTSVKDNYRDELQVVEEHLANRAHKFYAIGEAGIDLYWDKTHEAEQRDALNIQFDLALQYDLPMVIHTRNSMDITLKMIASRNDPRLRGVFHCFSGDEAQAKQAIALGFMLGIGGVVTYKNSGLQPVVQNIPLEYILLETDAPWLTPVPHRGKRNEPAYIPLIAQKIAEIKRVSVEEVAGVTTVNAERVFGVKGVSG
jgi:TatD DNase family protein